jgi:hypothetical protein
VPDNDFYFRYVALDRPPRSPLPFAYTIGVVIHWNLGSSFSGNDRDFGLLPAGLIGAFLIILRDNSMLRDQESKTTPTGSSSAAVTR